MIQGLHRASKLASLLAVRHAPTLADGLCVGDAEVASAMTAEQAADSMRSQTAGHRFASVWTSPRLRCLEPARVLSGQMQIPLQVDERLHEIHLGIWQGQPWSAIEATDGERLQAWMSNWTTTAPPEGETMASLVSRVGSWWNALPSGCHLLVAHAGVVRALRVVVQQDPWPQAMSEPVPHLQGRWFGAVPLGDPVA
jgi:alpha-ribazole phosphatase